MSLAIKVARSRYQGDSFLGDVLGVVGRTAVGFLTGGPAGAIVGGVSALTGGKSQPAAQPKPSGAMPGTGIQVQIPTISTPIGGIGGGGIQMGSFGPAYTAHSAAQTAAQQQLMCMPAGAPRTRLNKSSYYTQQGYVPAGTKCVKVRTMNPLNPRALSKAMRRLTSAKKAASVLGRISIRSARCKKC